MKSIQAELLGLEWRTSPQRPFRLRVNDVVRFSDGKVGLVIRVSECSAVVLMNRPRREFKTRFDKQVQFQPPPGTIRISANAEVEVLNHRTKQPKRKRRR